MLQSYDVTRIQNRFKEQFNAEPLIVRSPGRVNIIGEHTDYNEGFVLPAAIDKAIYVAVSKSADNRIHLYAEDFSESFEAGLDAIQPSDKGWPNYILGVVDQFQKAGLAVGGFNLVLDGNVPIGAGLSSSAAVECATVYALNELFGLGIDKMRMVKMAQKAEHTFAGVLCGIMDQFASMFGKAGHVIRLDCRSLEYEYEPLDMAGIVVLLLNTNVKHSLSSSEYNTRRSQCEQGVAWVKEHQPEVKSLRDVTPEMLIQHVLPKDELIYKRCKYVVEENIRLLEGCEDLKRGDVAALGKKMFQTHYGLSQEYEVSCKELDFLVDAVKDNPAVLGARMMGGGFGGCTINLIREEAIQPLVERLSKEYKAATGLELTPIVARIEEGTSVIKSEAYAGI
ncbi:galactokinase [Paraflavisolibacter sp. H34]|uniref:galactokinase n=1 Tax=Huijunlia imazamoxiresistens TaxID=3127457 RepID=UPI0030161E5D